MDIYENETLKKQYYLLNKSYFDGKLTFECLGSSDSDNPSKFDKTLLGISVDLNFSNNTYTMSINFITNTYSNVILSKVGAFDDTTKYTNAKEYYFYDIDGKSYSYTFNEPSEDKTVLSHYICNTNDCNLYVSDNYFAVIRDDKYYYVYNVKTGNIINSFSKEEKYSVTSIVTKNNFPSGVILQYHKDSKTRVSYYDFYYGKETIDDKMCDYIYKSISDNYLYCSKDGSTNLVNTKGELIKEEINNSVSDDNGNVYFYESHHTSQGLLVKKLYDKDFNVIYTEKNDDEKLQYYNLIPDGDSITFATNKKFYTYNGNSKSYESKEEYKEIYRIFNNHAVVNKDGYATIIDYNEKVITTLCKLTTENQVKEVYMNDEDNVIIVYVSDPNITASDIEETVYNKDVINNKEMFEKYKEGRTFYKYNYYINESRIEKKADFI